MSTPHKLFFSLTRRKYVKFKTRLEKNLATGRFYQLPRKRRHALVSRVEKFRLQMERFAPAKGAAIAGSLVAGMTLPNLGQAQNPDFRKSTNALPIPDDARSIKIRNMDADPQLEVVVSTASGGYIVNGNDEDGFTATSPTGLSGVDAEFEVGDIDGDGHLDIVYHDGLQFIAALNDGSGGFSSSANLTPFSSSIFDLQLVDLDADLDLDIAFVTGASYLYHSLNNGSGSFAPYSTINTGSKSVSHIEVADMDGDGDMDMVAGTYYAPGVYTYGFVSMFENSTNGMGLPAFGSNPVEEFTISKYTYVTNLAVADFDNDGDLDFAYATDGKYGYDLNFAENYFDSGGSLSFGIQTFPSVVESVNDLQAFDFEQDGNEDFLVATGGETHVFESSGTGFTKKKLTPALGGTYGDVAEDFLELATGDIDEDGKIDFIGINSNTNYAYFDKSGAQVIKVANNEFSERTAKAGQRVGDLLPYDVDGVSLGGETFAFAVGNGTNDADNDRFVISGSDLDVGATDLDFETQSTFNLLINVSGGGTSSNVEVQLNLENSPEAGFATFAGSGSPTTGSLYSQIAADLDGDGDDEIISIASSGLGNVEIRDDILSGSPTIPFMAQAIAVADVDCDGDLDIVRAQGSMLYIHDNDGMGNISSTASLSSDTYESLIRTIGVGDFDQDGDNDFLIGGETAAQFVYNLGTSLDYTTSQMSGFYFTPEVNHVQVGDFDNDGQLDFALGVSNDNLYVYQNAGGGTFSANPTYSGGGATLSDVIAEDFDNDGNLDILLVYDDFTTILEGAGDGSFTTSADLVGTITGGGLVTGDLDGDEDLDFMVSRAYGTGQSSAVVFTNDGSNNFAEGQELVVSSSDTMLGMALGDVDGDDDKDLVTSASDGLDVQYNQNVAPTSINLSSTSFDEHLTAGAEIGTLSADDINIGDTHTFALATGDGSNDEHNGLFSIVGNSLQVQSDISFETTPQVNIYLSADDGTNTFEQAFVLDVNDINQGPTAITLSASSFAETADVGAEIATLTATDPNAGDTHTFSLVAGNGTNDADNGTFSILGDRLLLVTPVPVSFAEQTRTLNIYLQAEDPFGESINEAQNITVTIVLGLEDEFNNALGIYPNPGHNELQINLDNEIMGTLNLRVSDLSGKVMEEIEVEKNARKWSYSIDMRSAEAGVYLVEATIGDQRLVQRWVKE